MYDPFVGTGSMLVAAAHHRAVTLGADIDMRVIRLGKKDKAGQQVTSHHGHLQSKREPLLIVHQSGIAVLDPRATSDMRIIRLGVRTRPGSRPASLQSHLWASTCAACSCLPLPLNGLQVDQQLDEVLSNASSAGVSI